MTKCSLVTIRLFFLNHMRNIIFQCRQISLILVNNLLVRKHLIIINVFIKWMVRSNFGKVYMPKTSLHDIRVLRPIRAKNCLIFFHTELKSFTPLSFLKHCYWISLMIYLKQSYLKEISTETTGNSLILRSSLLYLERIIYHDQVTLRSQ